MSVRDLRDRYPGILIRQAIRLAAKGVAANQAKQAAGGGAAELGVSVGRRYSTPRPSRRICARGMRCRVRSTSDE